MSSKYGEPVIYLSRVSDKQSSRNQVLSENTTLEYEEYLRPPRTSEIEPSKIPTGVLLSD